MARKVRVSSQTYKNVASRESRIRIGTGTGDSGDSNDSGRKDKKQGAEQIHAIQWWASEWRQFVGSLFLVCRRFYRVANSPDLYRVNKRILGDGDHDDEVVYEQDETQVEPVSSDGPFPFLGMPKEDSICVAEPRLGKDSWIPLSRLICGVEKVGSHHDDDTDGAVVDWRERSFCIAEHIRRRFVRDGVLDRYVNSDSFNRGRKLRAFSKMAVLRFLLWSLQIEEEEKEFPEFTNDLTKEILGQFLQLHQWETSVRFGYCQSNVLLRLGLERRSNQMYRRKNSDGIVEWRNLAHRAHLKRRLKYHVELSKKYAPGEEKEEYRKSCSTLLKQMEVDEVQERPVEECSIEQLVFDLRTMNGQQFMQPGSVDLNSDPRGDSSPFAKISALGLGKVFPLCLEHWEDETLSRSVGYHRNFHFSHRVLTVGTIFQRLGSTLSGAWFQNKEEAESYWEEFNSAGSEREFLEQRLMKDPRANLYSYFNKYEEDPSGCVEFLEKLLLLPEVGENVRNQSVEYLLKCGLDFEGVEPLLRHQLISFEHMAPAVALVLRRRDDAEVVAAIRRCFDKDHDDWGWGSPVKKMVPALLLAGERDYLLQRISSEDEMCVQMKVNCIDSLKDSLKKDEPEGLLAAFEPILDELHSFVEEVLVVCLNDFRRENSSGSMGDVSFSNLRVRDRAAVALSSLNPERMDFTYHNYAFSEKKRDALIQERICSHLDGYVGTVADARTPEEVPLTKSIERALIDLRFDDLETYGPGIVKTVEEFLCSHSYLSEESYEEFLMKKSFVVYSVTLDTVALGFVEEVTDKELSYDVLDILLAAIPDIWGVSIERDEGEYGIEICLSTQTGEKKGTRMRWKCSGDAHTGNISTSSSSPLGALIREHIPIEEMKVRAGWKRGFILFAMYGS